MMHELRLPEDHKNSILLDAKAADEAIVRKHTAQYYTHKNALYLTGSVIIVSIIYVLSDVGLQEVWTICRIFRRNMSHRKSAPDWREMPAKRKPTNSRPKTEQYSEAYISFGAPEALENEKKLVVGQNMSERNQLQVVSEQESCSSTVLSDEAREFLVNGNWDEIVSAMDYSFDPYHF